MTLTGRHPQRRDPSPRLPDYLTSLASKGVAEAWPERADLLRRG